MSLEILKHRHLGQFMDRTQYLRRKVVIPLELPKTVRGKTFPKIYFGFILTIIKSFQTQFKKCILEKI